MIFRFVMAHLLPPDHEVDIQEVEPAQPELAQAQHLPPLPNHIHPNIDEEDQDEEEEEPFEDDEDDILILQDVSSDEEMNEPELIYPYAAPGSPYPPSSPDTPSDSEPKPEEVATVGTITQVPLTGRRFPRSIHERGGSSSAAPITYELEDLVPGTMRRIIDSLYGKVMVLERQMMVRETEGECSLSRDKLVHKRMDLLDFDLGVVEHQQDETKREVNVLGKHVRELDDVGVRAENKKLKHELGDVRLSRTFDRMKNERLERDLYELRCWTYAHWGEMIRLRYVKERSYVATNVLAVYGETPPPKPNESPRDPQ